MWRNFVGVYKKIFVSFYDRFFTKRSIINFLFCSFFILILICLILMETLRVSRTYHIYNFNVFILFLFFISFYLSSILLIARIAFYKTKFKYLLHFSVFSFFIVSIFLAFYFHVTKHSFSWKFFINNSGSVFVTLANIFGSGFLLVAFVLILIIIISGIIFLLRLKPIKSKLYIFLSLMFVLIGVFIFDFKSNVHIFLERIFLENKIIDDYNEKYLEVLNNYKKISTRDFDGSKFENSADIYFLHLESVNGDLVNEEITPEFLKYADKYGVVLDNFFSNTIQTLEAEESILCALPPSLHGYFINTNNLKEIYCLPKIMNNFGYQTLFFKSHDLKFTRSGDFMKGIGFQEVHNKDIMKKNDPILDWGFREDVFYQRVWEYLKLQENRNKFVYVSVSSTNHYPFGDETPTDRNHFLNKIKTSVNLQDKYLGMFLKKLTEDKKKKYIFIYSDNAWPLGEHSFYNEVGAYRENFTIPFAFLVVNDDFDVKKINQENHSQLDITNTLLDLLKIKKEGVQYLGKSFYKELYEHDIDENLCVFNLQPFGNINFSFFINDEHFIYDSFVDRTEKYNLLDDKKEKQPIIVNNFLEVYRKCLLNLGFGNNLE